VSRLILQSFVNGFGKVVVIAHFPSNGEGRAAQGFQKPTAKIIEETADRWAFLVKELEMKVSK
jgi:hypothetical protein